MDSTKTIQEAVNELATMPVGSTIELPRNGGIWYVMRDFEGIWSQRRDHKGVLYPLNRETPDSPHAGK